MATQTVFRPSGAAVKLEIARSTLESKIGSLSINKNRFKAYLLPQRRAFQLPDISTIGRLPCRTLVAPCVTEWPANEPEDVAHAIVYSTKTKPTRASKNNRRRVATQMPGDGDSSSHQSVGAVAAHESAKERQLCRASSASQRYK